MRGLIDRWKEKRNALVLRVANYFNVDGVGRRSESDKDLEILLLRHQLVLDERKHLSRGEKLMLIALGNQAESQDWMHDQGDG